MTNIVLTLLAALWVTALAVTYFWLGIWIGATYGAGSAVPYFTLGLVVYGVVGYVPFSAYVDLEKRK